MLSTLSCLGCQPNNHTYRLATSQWYRPLRWFLMALWIVSVLAACTTVSPIQLPSTYATDDATHLALLSWQQSNQDLSGTWNTWSRENPTPLSGAFSGHVQESTVSLIIGNSVLQGSDTGARLTLTGRGQFPNTQWVALSPAQARLLSTAFVREASLHMALQHLQDTLTTPAPDSDPYTYAELVQSAQASVLHLQQQADSLLTQGNPCESDALTEFRSLSPSDETFVLSPVQLPQQTAQQNAQLVVNASTLQTQILTTQSAWQAALHTSIPVLPLSFSWRSATTTEPTRVTQGHTQRALLQDALTHDFTTMVSLHDQAHRLSEGITTLARQHGC